MIEASDSIEPQVREEVEFARSVTAVVLAVKLNLAERKTQEAYDRVIGRGAKREAPLREKIRFEVR